jgi:hypothetical protein
VFPGFADLDVPVLAKVLRHTVVSALVVGSGAVLLALVLSAPFAGVGIGLGVGAALLNLRFLDSAVSKVQTTGVTDKKVVRRSLGLRTASRLAVITALAVGLMFLNGGLGIGMVVGLVIFQVLFVINVSRAILSSGVL